MGSIGICWKERWGTDAGLETQLPTFQEVKEGLRTAISDPSEGGDQPSGRGLARNAGLPGLAGKLVLRPRPSRQTQTPTASV